MHRTIGDKMTVALAYSTLVADAYLILASIAARMGVRSLPPFGQDRASEASILLTMLVATWTSALAVATLSSTTVDNEKPQNVSWLWHLLVLIVAWLGHLISWAAMLF